MNRFEAMYQDDPDPWGFRDSWYERRKYAITTASLPQERYGRVWEPGCSIGELTALLAGRADRVDASDVSETAVRTARERTHLLAGVTVEQVLLPAAPPGERYDLVVLSELLYYLEAADREQVLRDTETVTAPGADLVVVHWRHHPDDAHAPGAEVNAAVRARPGWRSVARHDEPDFVLDVLTRTGSTDEDR